MNTYYWHGNHYTDLWTSDNKRWKIVKRQWGILPHCYSIEVQMRNRYDYYDHVTPFDVSIPKYVDAQWSRIYWKEQSR